MYNSCSVYSVYSVYDDRWEIVRTTDTSHVLAVLHKDSDFPLGVNKWKFLDENCTDAGLEWRTLREGFKLRNKIFSSV